MIRFSYRGTIATAVVSLTVSEMAHFNRINETGAYDHIYYFSMF
jgi:hypothetical protein